jgi:hypothetical protein
MMNFDATDDQVGQIEWNNEPSSSKQTTKVNQNKSIAINQVKDNRDYWRFKNSKLVSPNVNRIEAFQVYRI